MSNFSKKQEMNQRLSRPRNSPQECAYRELRLHMTALAGEHQHQPRPDAPRQGGTVQTGRFSAKPPEEERTSRFMLDN